MSVLIMGDALTDEKQPSKNRSLADRAKELVHDILEALEDLFPQPQPELVPIPDRHRRRR